MFIKKMTRIPYILQYSLEVRDIKDKIQLINYSAEKTSTLLCFEIFKYTREVLNFMCHWFVLNIEDVGYNQHIKTFPNFYKNIKEAKSYCKLNYAAIFLLQIEYGTIDLQKLDNFIQIFEQQPGDCKLFIVGNCRLILYELSLKIPSSSSVQNIRMLNKAIFVDVDFFYCNNSAQHHYSNLCKKIYKHSKTISKIEKIIGEIKDLHFYEIFDSALYNFDNNIKKIIICENLEDEAVINYCCMKSHINNNLKMECHNIFRDVRPQFYSKEIYNGIPVYDLDNCPVLPCLMVYKKMPLITTMKTETLEMGVYCTFQSWDPTKRIISVMHNNEEHFIEFSLFYCKTKNTSIIPSSKERYLIYKKLSFVKGLPLYPAYAVQIKNLKNITLSMEDKIIFLNCQRITIINLLNVIKCLNDYNGSLNFPNFFKIKIPGILEIFLNRKRQEKPDHLLDFAHSYLKKENYTLF